MKTLVFDIKRFATHDGHGLRTTVFFKGCPLRCQWCQNPEGLSSRRQVIYFEKKCMHCMRCVSLSKGGQVTYDKIIHVHQKGNYDEIIQQCPSNALRYDSEYMETEELVESLKTDQVFFQNNGGVTISGGEPFLQFDALKALLIRLKEEGLSTAIETSLYTSLDHIKEVEPYLDLIYCDLKIYDEDKHIRYTGVSSKCIKENIRYLLNTCVKKVIVRTPLIPGVNDDEKSIKDISAFLYMCNHETQYELLNYNPLAPSKYALYHLSYPMGHKKRLSENHLQLLRDTIKSTGIHHIIKE